MTKAELVGQIANESGITKAQAEKTVTEIVEPSGQSPFTPTPATPE